VARVFALSVLLLVASSGCAPDDPRPLVQLPVQESVVGTMMDLELETFVALVDSAGMRPDLLLPGPFTIYAPDEAAFQAVDPRLLGALRLRQNRQALRELLRYHIVPDSLTLARFEGEASFRTLQAEALTITAENHAVTLTDAQGRTAQVELPGSAAGNGIVYVIDRVLFHVPPRMLLNEVDAARAP
jgi:uncharacterized surface protein with fasciclin (FAS1) repeats